MPRLRRSDGEGRHPRERRAAAAGVVGDHGAGGRATAPRCSTAPTPRPRSSSAASTSSTCPTSTPRSRGPAAARAQCAGASRCVRSGPPSLPLPSPMRPRELRPRRSRARATASSWRCSSRARATWRPPRTRSPTHSRPRSSTGPRTACRAAPRRGCSRWRGASGSTRAGAGTAPTRPPDRCAARRGARRRERGRGRRDDPR